MPEPNRFSHLLASDVGSGEASWRHAMSIERVLVIVILVVLAIFLIERLL